MDRGFFLADGSWTCYRRNYFQVSVALQAFAVMRDPASDIACERPVRSDEATPWYVETSTISPSERAKLPSIINSHTSDMKAQFLPVKQFYVNISCFILGSLRQVEMVQHSTKRDKGPLTAPLPRPILIGGNVHLAAMAEAAAGSLLSSASKKNNPDKNPTIIDAPADVVTFERIQFKAATQNNGKRRAQQQYFILKIDVYAELDLSRILSSVVHEQHQTYQISIGSTHSAPLVVRGRSPGHYSDDKNESTNIDFVNHPPSQSVQPQSMSANSSSVAMFNSAMISAAGGNSFSSLPNLNGSTQYVALSAQDVPAGSVFFIPAPISSVGMPNSLGASQMSAYTSVIPTLIQLPQVNYGHSQISASNTSAPTIVLPSMPSTVPVATMATSNLPLPLSSSSSGGSMKSNGILFSPAFSFDSRLNTASLITPLPGAPGQRDTNDPNTVTIPQAPSSLFNVGYPFPIMPNTSSSLPSNSTPNSDNLFYSISK